VSGGEDRAVDGAHAPLQDAAPTRPWPIRTWTLGLDTATPATVAAAVAPGGAEASRIDVPAPGERPGHTRLLLGLAERVLTATGGTWGEVGRIVLGLGPGTFTGIRVGVATGRALALAGGAELVGVPTPFALAGAAAGPRGAWEGEPVLVVQNAGRRELFLTLVPEGGGAPPAESPAAVGGPSPWSAALFADPPVPWTVPQADLAAALRALPLTPAVAVGDGVPPFADVLRAAGIGVPEDPRAHQVSGLWLIRTADGIPATTPDLVRPVYVRDADAVPTAQRR
jgi:tRNA threonylcarbamoyladenosine biosynthesis protein TsaB